MSITAETKFRKKVVKHAADLATVKQDAPQLEKLLLQDPDLKRVIKSSADYEEVYRLYFYGTQGNPIAVCCPTT